MKKVLPLVILCCAVLQAVAQIEVRTEAQFTGAFGDHAPLWLNANKYGLGSVDSLSGYVRAGLFRSIEQDSARRWGWGGGIDVAVGRGLGSNVILHQAYGEVRWLKGMLTLGSKEQPVELKNQTLSSGAQTLGVNSRPVPGVRLSLPDYWTIPFTRGLLALKGHIFYGMQTDDNWQRQFTTPDAPRTVHTKIHTKAGYLRVGRPDKPLTIEAGLEMGTQYGGTSYTYSKGHSQVLSNSDGINGMLRAFFPGGGEKNDANYHNANGNHLGSWLLRVNYDKPSWGVSLYADHYFEDHSAMFLLDYDGYGHGKEWDERKENRYFMYALKDMMLGLELRLHDFRYVNAVVLEYLYTKYQSGPMYHDHTPTMSDHVSGLDDYYNHYIYTGWQHWGQVMGNPLYRSPLYNTDGYIRTENNRFWAWHLGVNGQPSERLSYRMLATLQRGWGTYHQPLTDPCYNVSLLLEGEYRLPYDGWSVKGAVGADLGELLGDNLGLQLTVAKRFNLKKR